MSSDITRTVLTELEFSPNVRYLNFKTHDHVEELGASFAGQVGLPGNWKPGLVELSQSPDDGFDACLIFNEPGRPVDWYAKKPTRWSARLACSSCEITVLSMNDRKVAARAKNLGIRSVPAVVINGQLALDQVCAASAL